MALDLYQNRTKSLSQSLDQQIESSNLISDLLPIMNSLFDLKELKIICKNKLKELNNKLKIRKVYFNSNPFYNILTNDLIIHILKFNETKEYPTMFCLSKTFNQLMNKNPILFTNYQILINNNTNKHNPINFLCQTNHISKCVELSPTTNINSSNIKFPFVKLHNLKLNDLKIFKNKFLLNKYKLNQLIESCYHLSTNRFPNEQIQFKNIFSFELNKGMYFHSFKNTFNFNKLLNLKFKLETLYLVFNTIQFLKQNCNNLLVLGIIS